MAKLETKLTVTSYNLMDLSEEELRTIFNLTLLVGGLPNGTYRENTRKLFCLIKEKTGWDTSQNPKMFNGSLEALPRTGGKGG